MAPVGGSRERNCRREVTPAQRNRAAKKSDAGAFEAGKKEEKKRREA